MKASLFSKKESFHENLFFPVWLAWLEKSQARKNKLTTRNYIR
jgi:hypothetical protein